MLGPLLQQGLQPRRQSDRSPRERAQGAVSLFVDPIRRDARPGQRIL